MSWNEGLWMQGTWRFVMGLESILEAGDEADMLGSVGLMVSLIME